MIASYDTIIQPIGRAMVGLKLCFQSDFLKITTILLLIDSF